MKNKKVLITGISIITFCLLFVGYIQISNSKLNTKILETEATLISKQNLITSNIQENIKLNEYTTYLDPYDIAPLSALVTIRTEQDEEVVVTVKGKNGSPDLISNFEATTDHFLPIYGLYPDTDNKVIIQMGNQSEEIIIKTNPLPDDFSIVDETYVNENYRHLLNDFYFLTPASSGYTSAYDINGNVRWYLSEPLVWEIRYLENGNLTLSNEKVINPPYYTTGMYELTMLGQIQKEYILPDGYHHDVTELPNGNMIVASSDFANNTVEDVIVEVDRTTGDIVKTIDLKEILDVDGGKSENWIDYDWFHNNSVFYDEKTNSLTLSGRHQDLVVNLDYDTLKINYLVGENTNFSDTYQKYFLQPINGLEWSYSQHAAKILPNGNLFVFDNGINRSKEMASYISAEDNYSRGVIYEINQDNMTIEQVYEYGKERGSDYFSAYVSDVDYLADDHYLIHSGGISKLNGKVLNNAPGLSEFDELNSYTSEVLNDELIFELKLNNNFYRAEKMNIYADNKFTLTDAITVGQLTEMQPDKVKHSNFKKIHNSDRLENYDLTFNKESDRLVVAGNFEKSDEVKIILKQDNEYLYHDVRISERPYTAMCIVVFDNQKQNVTKYINDSSAYSGDYEIIVQINDKLYNSGYKVSY